MRVVRLKGEAVALVVSRRNLRALLAKLDGDQPYSRATLVEPDQGDGAPRFSLHAEEDAAHYADRDPGPMHAAPGYDGSEE